MNISPWLSLLTNTAEDPTFPQGTFPPSWSVESLDLLRDLCISLSPSCSVSYRKEARVLLSLRHSVSPGLEAACVSFLRNRKTSSILQLRLAQ
jgi:hypothetical protein